MQRPILLLLFACLSGSSFAQKPFVDPTGTYTLKGDIANHQILGHSGEIRVKLLGSGRVAVSLYINKGYPEYSAATFTDTLAYDQNVARWTPADHPEYTVLIAFSRKEAETMQLFDGEEPRSSFGENVMVSAVFEKSSNEIPVIQDLSAHGITRS
ncbi:MAG: hypothetical protein Q8927_06590 [Bacteroidota bacterium]|nr:hypothetical protein [Bacteroidota bacterium]MDP4215851.1 hypothetical protein [Bacteroidota bacterium]MDP4247934.1 hypothetical protein [Bacteroidota bacterium]MDP4253997.1 hypothetical protein [Bacteroidota bacterium]MDP4258414.1 hypothetical protein [Bacteroidota bacterium]